MKFQLHSPRRRSDASDFGRFSLLFLSCCCAFCLRLSSIRSISTLLRSSSEARAASAFVSPGTEESESDGEEAITPAPVANTDVDEAEPGRGGEPAVDDADADAPPGCGGEPRADDGRGAKRSDASEEGDAAAGGEAS